MELLIVAFDNLRDQRKCPCNGICLDQFSEKSYDEREYDKRKPTYFLPISTFFLDSGVYFDKKHVGKLDSTMPQTEQKKN